MKRVTVSWKQIEKFIGKVIYKRCTLSTRSRAACHQLIGNQIRWVHTTNGLYSAATVNGIFLIDIPILNTEVERAMSLFALKVVRF